MNDQLIILVQMRFILLYTYPPYYQDVFDRHLTRCLSSEYLEFIMGKNGSMKLILV